MKIHLIRNVFIRGEAFAEGSVTEVDETTGKSLIQMGKADLELPATIDKLPVEDKSKEKGKGKGKSRIKTTKKPKPNRLEIQDVTQQNSTEVKHG